MRTGMIRILLPIFVVGLLLGLISRLEAQQSERVYPIIELTDENVALIDLHDGDIGDWREVIGDPSITLLDFGARRPFEPHDPHSLDLRIWLAWHDATNRIYVGMERAHPVWRASVKRHT
jgi:hypothetical protein